MFDTSDILGRTVSLPAQAGRRVWLQFHRFAA
jgi:hypothetical protein